MKENAILIRPLDVLKVHVDFSKDDAIEEAVQAKRVSTIHTAKTQELSSLLGVHLVGYVDREGNDINNPLACQISGYDYLGSFMLLCKTDDKWNNSGFSEAELNSVYTYLTTGKVISSVDTKGAKEFFDRYPIDVPLLNVSIEPTYYWKKEVPYVLLVRYDISNASDKQFEEFGKALFTLSSRLINEFTEVRDNVKRSPNGDFYLKCFYEPGQFYNILIQAVEEDDDEDKVIIYKAEDVIYKGFLATEEDKDTIIHQTEDTMEEAYEPEYDDEEMELLYDLVIQMDVNIEIPDHVNKPQLSGQFCYPMLNVTFDDNDRICHIPVIGDFLEIVNYSGEEGFVVVKVLGGKEIKLELDNEVTLLLEGEHKNYGPVLGNVKLSLKEFDLVVNGEHRLIEIKDTIIDEVTNEVLDSPSGEADLQTHEEDDNDVAEVGVYIYQVLCVGQDNTYAIIDSLEPEAEEMEHYYYLVSDKKPTVYQLHLTVDNGRKIVNTITMEFKKE